MIYGNDLVKVLKDCEYIKGIYQTRYKCFDCPMFINEKPCKTYYSWWTQKADLNNRKIREEKNGKRKNH